jgi:hypothetical protein
MQRKGSMDKLLMELQKAQMEALDKQRKDLVRHLEIERKKYEELLEKKLNLKNEEAQRENERYRSEKEENKKKIETEKARRDAEIYREQQQERQGQ